MFLLPVKPVLGNNHFFKPNILKKDNTIKICTTETDSNILKVMAAKLRLVSHKNLNYCSSIFSSLKNGILMPQMPSIYTFLLNSKNGQAHKNLKFSFFFILILGGICTIATRLSVIDAFPWKLNLLLFSIGFCYISFITFLNILKITHIPSYYNQIKKAYKNSIITKLTIIIYYIIFLSVLILSFFVVYKFTERFSAFFLISLFLSLTVVFFIAIIAGILFSINKNNKPQISLNLNIIRDVSTIKSIFLISFKCLGVICALFTYVYMFIPTIECQPDSDEPSSSRAEPVEPDITNIVSRTKKGKVLTHFGSAVKNKVDAQSTELFNNKDSITNLNILNRDSLRTDEAVLMNKGSRTLSPIQTEELSTEQRLHNSPSTEILREGGRLDKNLDLIPDKNLESHADILEAWKSGRIPTKNEIFSVSKAELHKHLSLPLKLTEREVKELINNEFDILSASYLIEKENFIKNLYSYNHMKELPEHVYKYLCEELARNAILQTPDNKMQQTLLNIWLLNPSENGIKCKFIYFNNSYSCLIDGGQGRMHNLVFPVSDKFRYDSPFFFYHKIRLMSEEREPCLIILNKLGHLLLLKEQYSNIFFDMECGFQDKESLLIQDWGSKISKFYTPYYVSQENVIIIKVLHNRDAAFLAIPGHNPLDLLAMLEGILDAKNDKFNEFLRAAPRINPRTTEIIDERLVTLVKTQIKDIKRI